MYSNRRGLANPQTMSDHDTRDANATLMRSRRKQVLLAQLQEKEELLKQYTNPRGIGMRGQTVPQRDVDILQQQIAALRAQVEDQADLASNYTPTPLGSARSPQQQQQQQQPPSSSAYGGTSFPPTPGSSYSQPPSSHYGNGNGAPQLRTAFPTGVSVPSTGARSTRRDEVWHAKYQRWLHRQQPSNSGGASSYGNGGGGLTQQQLQQHGAYAPPPPASNMSSYSQPSAAPAQHQGYGQQGGMPPLHPASSQQQQHGGHYSAGQAPPQEQPRFGRRATPPTEALLQQQQQVHAHHAQSFAANMAGGGGRNGMNGGGAETNNHFMPIQNATDHRISSARTNDSNAASQPVHGRRAQQSTRPW